MASDLKISGPIPQAPPPPPSAFQRFKASPIAFITALLKKRQPSIAPANSQTTRHITIVCISDTHNSIPPNIPSGDILLHAGNLTTKGTFDELQAQLNWLNTLPHQHKIVIAGNHDRWLDREFVRHHPERMAPQDVDRQDKLEWSSIQYLENKSTNILIGDRTITIYGSPMTPQCGTFAFQHPPIRDIWEGYNS